MPTISCHGISGCASFTSSEIRAATSPRCSKFNSTCSCNPRDAKYAELSTPSRICRQRRTKPSMWSIRCASLIISPPYPFALHGQNTAHAPKPRNPRHQHRIQEASRHHLAFAHSQRWSFAARISQANQHRCRDAPPCGRMSRRPKAFQPCVSSRSRISHPASRLFRPSCTYQKHQHYTIFS